MKKRINISIDAPLHAWGKLRAAELTGGDFSLYITRLIERDKISPSASVLLSPADLDALRRAIVAEVAQELRARPTAGSKE